MPRRFNADRDYALLRQLRPDPGIVEVRPRVTRYGSPDAEAIGLEPIEAVPDVLVPEGEYAAVVSHAHEQQAFPIYHMYDSWAPPGYKFNQNGLGYCWTWSGTGAVMTLRALEDKDFVPLAPVSMGYLVGWRNNGNYLESFIQGAREDGICPAVNGEINSHKNSRSYWDQHDADRHLYRLDKVWDTNARAGDDVMIQHCLSILSYGRPLYCAWNWWGHAVLVVGMRWDETEYKNIVWLLRNSHNEDDVIELTGSRGVPDEAYGFVSTVLV